MIRIQKSKHFSLCDILQASIEQLKAVRYSHIDGVRRALNHFQKKLQEAGERHDFTKLDGIDQFHSDINTESEIYKWLDKHRKVERHHIDNPNGVREDIDLIDVLEFIADCVTAGMARAGAVYDLKLDNELLQKAFKNTTDKLKAEIEVEK